MVINHQKEMKTTGLWGEENRSCIIYFHGEIMNGKKKTLLLVNQYECQI